MVRLPKVNYLVKGHILNKIYSRVKLKRSQKHCVKDISRPRLVRPYEHVKLVPNFKPHDRQWWHCGWIFKFCKFWRKKKEIEPFDVISENSSPKGFFWPNKKKSVISLLSADSQYFWTYTLKYILTISSYHTSRRTVNHLSTVYNINIILTQLFL